MLIHDFQADGRIIKVYANPRGYASETSDSPRHAATGGSAHVVDGKMGFPESGNGSSNSRPDLILNNGNGGGKLYSDSMVGSSRRGRGRR